MEDLVKRIDQLKIKYETLKKEIAAKLSVRKKSSIKYW